ncbi:MAG TPA: hypothetical protein VFA67_02575, partial [Candidatus Sulfotelmatobacter sp.]|nr:hypothetical protein [Candidatus Sulfotelmatobacter sp.]
PLNPLIAIKVDPERDNPLLVPVRVPPLLLKSTLVSANDAAGIIKQPRDSNATMRSLRETIDHSLQKPIYGANTPRSKLL